MSYRGGLTAYFVNNGKRFNKQEEHLRTILEKNEDDCQNIEIDHLFPDSARPIHYACLYNSTEYFMNSKLPHTQINIPGGSYDSTPMMFTIKNSNYKILLSLLLNGADIFKKNSRSFNVLSFCALYDDALGMIVVLSFIEKNISINNYLELAQKENNKQTEEFLLERKNEIEGKEEVETSRWDKIFKLSKAHLIGALVCTVLGFIIQDFKWVIAASFFFVYCPFFIKSPFPLISNVVFSVYTYYETTKDLGGLRYLFFVFFFLHFISFLAVYFVEPPFLENNKVKKANSLITDLIFKDQYETDKFCFKCIRKQILVYGHCEKCKKCVSRHIFHCPLFDKCISAKTNRFIYKTYDNFTTVLYGFAVSTTYKARNPPFYVFLICLFSNVVTYLMYLHAEEKREMKILCYIRDKYDVPITYGYRSDGRIAANYDEKYEEWIENETLDIYLRNQYI